MRSTRCVWRACMLLEGWFRFRNCCCCNVSVGTVIIAVLALIGESCNFIAVCALPSDAAKESDSPAMAALRQTIALLLTPATRAVIGILSVLGITFSALLLYGNANAKPQFMKPAVYFWLIMLVLNSIFRIVMVSSATVESAMVASQIVGMIINIIITLLLIQVVRSRIADIEESKGPEIPFSQGFQTN